MNINNSGKAGSAKGVQGVEKGQAKDVVTKEQVLAELQKMKPGQFPEVHEHNVKFLENLLGYIDTTKPLSEEAIFEALGKMEEADKARVQALTKAEKGNEALNVGQGESPEKLNVSEVKPEGVPLTSSGDEVQQVPLVPSKPNVVPGIPLGVAPEEEAKPLDEAEADKPEALTPAQQGVQAKLKVGTVLGLDINAHELNICDALANTKDSKIPGVHLLFQCMARWYTGNWDGYKPEEIARIRAEQAKMTAENMDKIRELLRQKPMDYVHTTAEIAKLTGGLVMVIGHPAGETEKKLEDMVRLYERWSESVQGDPEQKMRILANEMEKAQRAEEGRAFHGLEQALDRINYSNTFGDYEKEHPIEAMMVKGENEKDIKMFQAKHVPDDLSYDDYIREFVSRSIVAFIKSDIENGNGTRRASEFESRYKNMFPDDYDDPAIKQIIDEAIHEAVEKGFLTPYKPVYLSGNSVKEILDAEFRGAMINMPEADRRSPSKVIEYLRVYRGILDVKATRPGATEARNISERALYAYVNNLIKTGQLDAPLSHNDKTDINRILDEELADYLLNKPADAGNDYETIEAIKDYLVNTRQILNFKGIRKNNNTAKPINIMELEGFLNRQVRYNVIRREPKENLIGFDRLKKAWEGYLMAEKEGAEYEEAIIKDFSTRMKIRGVKDEDLVKLFEEVDARTKGVPGRAKQAVVPGAPGTAGLGGAIPVIKPSVVPTNGPVPEIKPVFVPISKFTELRKSWEDYLKGKRVKEEDIQIGAGDGFMLRMQFEVQELAKGVTQKDLNEFFADTKGKGKVK